MCEGIRREHVAGCRSDNVVLKAAYSWMENVAVSMKGANATIMLVAHNGVSCDFQMMFNYFHLHSIAVPSRVRYYFDTYMMVKLSGHYFNKSKVEEREGYTEPADGESGPHTLTNLHFAMFKRTFDNAHNAYADAEAGAYVAGHEKFWSKRFNAGGGMQLWSTLMDAKLKKYQKAWGRIKAPVEKSWTEFGDNSEAPSESVQDEYKGSCMGPAGDAKGAHHTLTSYFMLFFTSHLLQKIADETNKYGNTQWVYKGIITHCLVLLVFYMIRL